MTKEFGLDSWGKWSNGICAGLFFGLSIYLIVSFHGFHVLTYPFPNIPPTLTAVVPLALTLVLAMRFLLRLRTNIRIKADSIRYTKRLSSQELRVLDIKGVRIDKKRSWYYFEPVSSSLKPICIDDSSAFDADQELALFAKQFPDLDAIDNKADEEDFLSNPLYGGTVEERQRRRTRVEKISFYYSFAGIPLLLLVFFSRVEIVFIYFAYCLYGLVRLCTGKGLVSFNHVAVGLCLVSFAGMVRAITNYALLSPARLVISEIVFAAIMFLLFSTMGISRADKPRKLQSGSRWIRSISALNCSILFAYVVNCGFDFYTGSPFPARVESKQISKNRGTLSISLSPWGTRTASWTQEVNDSFFWKVQPGDRVIVMEKPGALGAAWFYMEKSPTE
jgi:hypothetical protein